MYLSGSAHNHKNDPLIMLSWSPRALAASTGNFHKDCVSDSWQNLRSGNGSSEMVPRWLWAPFLCLFSLALVVVKLKSILYAFQLVKEIQVQSFTCHPITHKWDFSWSDNCWQRWPSSLQPERRGQNASSALTQSARFCALKIESLWIFDLS